MFAQQLLSSEIFPLKKSDISQAALNIMQDWGIQNLPVVENGKVLGYVNQNMLLNKHKAKIESHIASNEPLCLKANTHLFEVIKTMHDNMLSVVAVVSYTNIFLGIISIHEIQKIIYPHSGLSQAGGIIVLEMNARNYSLAEIARISEVNDLKILQSQIENIDDEANTILVSLKYNSTDLQYTLATFKRFNYNIFYTTQNEIDEASENRYNWLIKYIGF